MREKAERDEEEEEVEIGSKEEESARAQPGRLALDGEGVCKPREEWLWMLRAVAVFEERRAV